jgi:hypothetical protein
VALGNEFAREFGKHGSAMLSFWLICLMAFNVFHAFFQRNLKPQVRRKCSMLHVARLISSRLYAEIPTRGPADNPPKFFHYARTIESNDPWCELLDSYDTSDDFALHPNGWSELLREDAEKSFIVLTDDGVNCSPYNDSNSVVAGEAAAAAFDADLLALSPLNFGNTGNRRYAFHSIIGVTPTFPPDAVTTLQCAPGSSAPGTGYQALSLTTGGTRTPICVEADLIWNDLSVYPGVDCHFPVPDAPGETIDLANVAVRYSPGGDTGSRITINQVADAGSCGADAFFIDGETIVLCPNSCAQVRSDNAPEVDVTFACEP